MKNDRFFRVNEQIRAPRVKLVDDKGEMKGVIPLREAMQMASDSGLDLVEVSPSEDKREPPVCKLLDYGKVKYEMKKKRKQNTKSSQSLKEIQVGCNTSDHDLGIKHAKVIEFLQSQHKVRYTMKVKGRQRFQTQRMMETFESNLEGFTEYAKWERPQVGVRGVTVLLTPV